MEEIQLFLAHAIQLEREAASRYDELQAMMQSAGNKEVAAFFADMARFARRHLEEAMQRGGFREIPQMHWSEFRWPSGVSPEAAAWEGVDALMDVQSALLLALDGEDRSRSFYSQVRDATQDPDVRRFAAEFAEEEAGHVEALHHWIERQHAGR
ncbi:ferritin family protein [Niveibacterium sp. SC-1]|uniref:ferritin-like domain-containing protein n=1 Tax=Niveibacterium sp. SC-1 TaxID=3135646 RepID=UPI00311FB6AB